MSLLIIVLFIFGCYLALWISRTPDESKGKVIASYSLPIIEVFIGVFLAIIIGTMVQKDQEQNDALRMIKASLMELNLFETQIKEQPRLLKSAKHLYPKQTAYAFFRNNPLDFPEITRLTLQDTHLTKLLSYVGIRSIYHEQRKLKKLLHLLKSKNLSDKECIENLTLIKNTTIALRRFLNFEYKYQNGQINKDLLIKFHDQYNHERESMNIINSRS